jgi:hypothetical protein
VVNISETPGVVILEYEVQGNAVGSGKLYENRFISVVTIEAAGGLISYGPHFADGYRQGRRMMS